MYLTGLGAVAMDSKPDLYSANVLGVQLNAVQFDLLEATVAFQASGSFRWYLQAVGCTLTSLWDGPHYCSSYTSMQYTKRCYILVLSPGLVTITMSAQPNSGSSAKLSNLTLFARKTGAMVPPPTSAPWFDPYNWAQTVDSLKGRTSKWVPGYKVRYAVTFLTTRGESSKGPWSPWIQDYYALPTLTVIPTGPGDVTQGRRIYRQFSGFDEEVVGEIDNNTDTRFPEDSL